LANECDKENVHPNTFSLPWIWKARKQIVLMTVLTVIFPEVALVFFNMNLIIGWDPATIVSRGGGGGTFLGKVLEIICRL